MIWKTIKTNPYYEVSDEGQVRRIKDGKILKQYLQKSGYVYVWINRGYGNYSQPVHRLVCEAFHENPDNKEFVDHIDTNRSNNNANNLRWATPEENNNNPISLVNKRKKRK